MPDAVVVGAGPNGLAAAIVLARAGRSVRVLEAADTVGGGMRTAELTLPGFRHDVCSAIHPGAVGSPFLRSLPLEEHGLEWIHPPAPLAHPFDDGTAAVLESSVAETAAGLGEDGAAYRHLFEPLVEVADDLTDLLLAPLRRPRHLRAATRFAASALLPATMLARRRFAGERARALFGGLAAHSILPLSRPPSGAVGLALGLFGHAFGWPLPRGGSQAIADALASYLRSLGAEIRCGCRVESLAELRGARVVLLDVTPRQFLALAGDALPVPLSPAAGRLPVRPRRLQARPRARRVDSLGGGRVQSGGDRPPRRNAGRDRRVPRPEVAGGRASGAPVRPARPAEPVRRHSGSERQAHRLGVLPRPQRLDRRHDRPRSRRRSSASPPVSVSGSSPVTRSGRPALERYNANYVGGDIAGGLQDLRQLFTRPVARLVPYSTPVRGVYLCSSSTPPGAGVHGMCGFHAARAALRGW